MPKSRAEVQALLASLDERSADELEAQDVDFKEWGKGDLQAVTKAVDWAVCMANGGGGTIVFGVADDLVGRRNAIVGVPSSLDIDQLRLAIYERTDPKLMPVFDEIDVPEGTGRVVAMHVHPGIPPYTDTSGKGLIRIGKDCKPLTGAMTRRFFTGHPGDSEPHRAAQADGHAEPAVGEGSKLSRRAQWEAAKARVLGMVQRQAARGADPLVNADIRRITGFDRHQVYRLVQEFAEEGRLRIDGHGRAARYVYRDASETNA